MERNGQTVFEELYKKPSKKEDLTSEEVEYERNKNELTFKPDIGSKTYKTEGNPPKKTPQKPSEEAKVFQKSPS